MFTTSRAKVIAYLVLTFALSSIFYVQIIGAGDAAGVDLYVLGLMWCPAIAAIVVRYVSQRNLRGQGWKLGKPGYLAFALLAPLIYALPVYLLVWATGLGDFSSEFWSRSAATIGLPASPLYGLVALLTFNMAISIIAAAGEEIGWRGLLVPELAKFTGFHTTVLISATIWTLYHLPILLMAGYNGGTTPLWYSLACFTPMVFAASYVFAWIRLESGSLWPAVLLHASHNLFVQGVFDSATRDTGPTRYITGEFGFGLVITIGIVALLIIRRQKKAAFAAPEQDVDRVVQAAPAA